MVKADRKISILQNDLKKARKEAEAFEAQHNIQVARLKNEKSTLQSSLDALQVRWTPSIGAFKQWMCKGSIDPDVPLLPIDPSIFSNETHHLLVHNALLGLRSQNWSSAYQDARKSIDIRPSTMGYITNALARIGDGETEEAIRVFDLAFWNCDPDESDLLLLIKTIVFFISGKYDEAISRVHDLIDISNDDETKYCYLQVLGKMYLSRGDYERAVQALERAQGFGSCNTGCHLESISMIFGWSFDGIQITVQRYHCEVLHAAGRAQEAAEALRKILQTFGGEIPTSNVTPDWVTDLKKKCVDKLEELGDAAFSSGEHGEAISHYTSALSLDPPNPIDIFVKRSKARAAKGLWKCALADANEVIKLDPSSHRGYERKHAALHAMEDYDEAINAISPMLSIIENSPEEEIRRLRENYTAPRETAAAIGAIIHEIFKICPLVLIDVTTGKLCDAQERVRLFKAEKPFSKLVSETATTKIDKEHILQAVAKYFKWIMFSHTWDGQEPTFQDVNQVETVWNLDESPLNEKLRQFCTMGHADGHRWAWSDTCCIDKSTSAILGESLTSMYSWYEEAAATLVFLADVLSSSKLGDLTKSRWMTRAWTLQELLASKVVRFYDCEWRPYLNDMHANHKESPAIKQELARAMGIASQTITNFRPEDLGVREKLRLASTRNATKEEDIAYSLIGIFSSDIVPRYGLGKTALGHLLENILAHSGDVTIVAWTGLSSLYNSSLPDSLAVYNQTPYSPPPMEATELVMLVEELRNRMPPEDALTFYDQVAEFPPATFSNRCLHLPCIVFSVTKIGIQDTRGSRGFLYRAMVSLLGKVEFRTVDDMPLRNPRKLVFVHPWLRDLRDPHNGFDSDESDGEVESNAGSDDEPEAESDAGPDNSIDDDSDTSASASPLHPEPAARVDRYTLALRLLARLGRPFNALLLEQQSNGRYKRVAAEQEIIVSGVPSDQITVKKGIRAKVLQIV